MVASETAFRDCTCGIGKSAWWGDHGVSCEYGQDLYAWIASGEPLTRTKDEDLTRMEGE